MPETPEHTFPASQALQLITLLARWGIDAHTLLAGSGIDERTLERPDTRLTVAQVQQLTRRARVLTGEPGIGIYLGLQKQSSMYGHVGFASMTSANVRQALELTVRFTPIATTAVTLSLYDEGDVSVLRVDQHLDLGDIADVAALSFAVGILHIFSGSTGVPAAPIAIDFLFPEPEYFQRFAHVLPQARFGQSQMRLTFSRATLDLPLLGADRAGLAVAKEACERKLLELGFASTLGARVRRQVFQNERVCTLEDVAKALHMSTRTLKRKLAAEGLTFAALCDQERHTRALALIEHADFSLDEIASRLGYSTPSNFVRAFRRWTGRTPAAFRSTRRR